MRRISRRRAAAIAAGTAAVVVAGTIAYAYWTNSGTGSGSAAVGNNATITVNQTSAVTGLYPGGPAAALSGTFDNPNQSKVYVHQVTASLTSVSNGTADGTKPACTIADFQLSDNPATVDAEINPGTASGAWGSVHVALKNGAANQDNCKNATLNISYASN
jgi:hypothetical protein